MNDIDELMSKPVLDLAPTDIDEIIRWHRQQRANRAAGIKPKKPTVDMSSVEARLNLLAPKAEPIKRRI